MEQYVNKVFRTNSERFKKKDYTREIDWRKRQY